ncbi:unnamed protein product [Ilex paraguariensis]|uniref:Septum-promoting GTP-binding protein 1 n=1 Tax=Ilex paraguariensis TaxID=185542 RepID=A0ABC8S1Z0_9AQUA
MAQRIRKATGKMTHLCRKIVHVRIRWSIVERVSVLGDFFRSIWERIVVCSIWKPSRYRRLSQRSSSPGVEAIESGLGHDDPTTTFGGYDSDSDLVALKISLLGDCQIGKTSFVIKYIGDEQEKRSLEMKGLNLMDKTLFVRGVRIAFRIWDTAIPILIGTKFDDFVQLPPDLQWTVVTQARAYARAMKAALFFSSATHNINVNKIFKFIVAKLFNLPWNLDRNLTIGEPIIDF